MKFVLLDQIVELDPGQRLTAVKNVSLAEEYLADHFPTFPVLPGVLMVEAMTQAAEWLVRASTGFAAALVTLGEARNVTYKSFLAPGQQLRVEVTLRKLGDGVAEVTGVGHRGDREVVKGRLSLKLTNLADEDARLADVDRELVRQARSQFELLGGPAALGAAAAAD